MAVWVYKQPFSVPGSSGTQPVLWLSPVIFISYPLVALLAFFLSLFLINSSALVTGNKDKQHRLWLFPNTCSPQVAYFFCLLNSSTPLRSNKKKAPAKDTSASLSTPPLPVVP